MQPLPSILLLGCGNMGNALWQRWSACSIEPSVVVDRHAAAAALPHLVVKNVAEIPKHFRPKCVVLAMKPAGMEAALDGLKSYLSDALLISVLAGRSCKTLASTCTALGVSPPILRIMPNTACQFGKGVIGAFPLALRPDEKQLATTLLAPLGETVWLEHEEQFDLLTPISGSGPAYFYLLAEILEKEAISRGFSPETARTLAHETMIGASATLAHSSEPSAQLRERVTSPNGVTAKALDVLMAQEAWPDLMRRALDAGSQRCRDMA